MINNLIGKNRKGFTAGLALLLASAMIMLLLIGPVLAQGDVVTRNAGVNRWDTSAVTALAAYPGGSDKVIIARGDDAGGWADGLAGGYLAGVLDAPILLTAPNSLPASVESAIATLGATKAYILGGTVAVSTDVEAKLQFLGLETERFAGANRQDTAALIANYGEFEITRVQAVQRNDVNLKGGAAAFNTAPTEGNLLVVIAGHRTGNPGSFNEPIITQPGWTRHEVSYSYSGTGDRRIVAIFSKVAGDNEGDTVNVDFEDTQTTVTGFVILQEFSGAEGYEFLDSGINPGTGAGGASLIVPALALPNTDNVLNIAGMVWRDDSPAITGLSFNNLGGLVSESSGGLRGASAFASGAGVTQTIASWTNDKMASGLFARFTYDTPIDTAFICQGRAPADSMVAGAAAFAKEYPILLVNQDNVPAETTAAINELGIKNLIIVGGPAVVSQAVQDTLAAMPGVNVTRLAGANREETSKVFAEDQFADSTVFSIVNGREGLVDAIGASVFGNPILYVRVDTIPIIVYDYLVEKVTSESMFYIFGGLVRISETVAGMLESLVSGEPGEPVYTVTFAEGNELDDVAIQVYSDEDRTVEVGDALTTDVGGEATIDLEDGEYWFTATLAGYADLEDGFTVTGTDMTVDFTMIPAFTVTFTETNSLAGVSIQVYDDAARTSPVGGPLTTDGSGIATVDLADGSYWFTASLNGYYNFESDFVVAGADVDVPPFALVAGAIESVQVAVASNNNPSFANQPAEGNLLVVTSAHRTGDPAAETGPTISGDGWELLYYEYFRTTDQNRRAIAMWAKVAGDSEPQGVTVTWSQAGASCYTRIQELTGAADYAFLAAGGNPSGTSEVNVLDLPDTALDADENDNILAIAGIVARDAIGTFNGFSGLDPSNNEVQSGSISLVTGFDWTIDGSGLWQTEADWTTNRLASGILALFTFDFN